MAIWTVNLFNNRNTIGSFRLQSIWFEGFVIPESMEDEALQLGNSGYIKIILFDDVYQVWSQSPKNLISIHAWHGAYDKNYHWGVHYYTF